MEISLIFQFIEASPSMEIIVTSLLAFVSTNIDDIFILMLFFGSRKISDFRIILGQYTGIGVLVAISFVGAFIGNFLDQRYIGILGIFPIYLAVKHVIELVKHQSPEDNKDNEGLPKSMNILAVAGVTIANGADNIGVYTPLLTTMSSIEKVQMIIIFAVMTYVWCLAGKYLASRPLIAKQLDRFGHIIMPVVLFSLGVFILLESETFSLLRP